MDELLQIADEMGVHVMWRDLGRRRGEYRAHPALVTLNPRMSRVLQRSTLAHELGHHHFGDTTWTDEPAIQSMRETRANAFAAQLLISPARYAAAERLVGPHAGALARELEVARYVVDAWRDQRNAMRAPRVRRSA